MAKQPSNCSLKCHLSVWATVPIKLGSLIFVFFLLFFAPLMSPPPDKMAVLSCKYRHRNWTDKKSFSSSPSHHRPLPVRFFFLLHAAWTIWLCSGCIPAAHSLSVPCAGPGTVDLENTGTHSAPGRCLQGVGSGREKSEPNIPRMVAPPT